MDSALIVQSECSCLKIAQLGEPPSGYLHTTAGVLIFASSDRHILYIGPMRNSETTTETLYQVLRLKKLAPSWAARLEAFANDNACGVHVCCGTFWPS